MYKTLPHPETVALPTRIAVVASLALASALEGDDAAASRLGRRAGALSRAAHLPLARVWDALRPSGVAVPTRAAAWDGLVDGWFGEEARREAIA